MMENNFKNKFQRKNINNKVIYTEKYSELMNILIRQKGEFLDYYSEEKFIGTILGLNILNFQGVIMNDEEKI